MYFKRKKIWPQKLFYVSHQKFSSKVEILGKNFWYSVVPRLDECNLFKKIPITISKCTVGFYWIKSVTEAQTNIFWTNYIHPILYVTSEYQNFYPKICVPMLWVLDQTRMLSALKQPECLRNHSRSLEEVHPSSLHRQYESYTSCPLLHLEIFGLLTCY